MCLPIEKEALSFKAILSDFFVVYGTSINQEKSKLFFFNSPSSIQGNIPRILEFQRSNLPSRYLDVPLTDKPLARSTWEALIIKMQKMLANSTFRSLNMADHLVLMKSILQEIPHHLYSALAALKAISNTIRNLQRNFLWRGLEKKHKRALVTWEKNV